MGLFRKAPKKNTKSEDVVVKVARAVSFDLDRPSVERKISKDRERYIKNISRKALTAAINT